MANLSALMGSVLAGTDAHVYVKDSSFHFVYGNAAVARTLHTTPEQMIGKADVDFVDKELASPFAKPINGCSPLVSQRFCSLRSW